MSADEELNAAKLDELKTALDDLKIVDVQRKPAGLSGDLKAAADFTNNNEAVLSLRDKGFYVADLEGRVELVSNEGEVRCAMKDGVQYVLRFGAIDTEGDNAQQRQGQGQGQRGRNAGGASPNRYIFVMAEFNPDMIAKPELQPLPEAKDQPAEKPADGAANDKAADAERSRRRRSQPTTPSQPTMPSRPTTRRKPTPTASGKRSRRRISGSRTNTIRRSPTARSTSRSSTTALPIGTTSSPTRSTARSTLDTTRSSRRKRPRPPPAPPTPARAKASPFPVPPATKPVRAIPRRTPKCRLPIRRPAAR